MEGRLSRGRGGDWKRHGRTGNDSERLSGEHRGRSRGGQYRGRGKREHHRGRGRGGGAHSADFHQRDQDEGDKSPEDGDRLEVFSRRKLESNWDRYEGSEKQESDEDVPVQRGTDYHVLLGSAGDSFTQFRFSEERDWEMDPFAASQMSAVFVDLPTLAQTLQQVPLHQRLNLEAELLQVAAPVELPAMTLARKQEMLKTSTFTPPSASFKSLSTNQKVPMAANPALASDLQVSSAVAQPLVDDAGDEELDRLLSLQSVAGKQLVSGADEETDIPEQECEEVKEVIKEKVEVEVKDKDVTPSKSASIKQEMTEEDLEDWLDSMIS
ncbi:cell death regulator Aven [Acanthochromis polyacanthus]|uniref:cell death regulator Aven n=1 Tax=Acanthochromis polyacanthus TaxID=80966 RepID=UPI002233E899|nr:cell death regulator Aven [Acanthochromis polyacanthus]